MRSQVRTRIAAGEEPEAIRAWLVERYGDYVSYAPRVTATTWPLFAAAAAAAGRCCSCVLRAAVGGGATMMGWAVADRSGARGFRGAGGAASGCRVRAGSRSGGAAARPGRLCAARHPALPGAPRQRRQRDDTAGAALVEARQATGRRWLAQSRQRWLVIADAMARQRPVWRCRRSAARRGRRESAAMPRPGWRWPMRWSLMPKAS